jgi:excisionase family DNA binding protein
MKEFLKYYTVANLLLWFNESGIKISKSTLYALIKKDEIPYIRVGAKYLFDIEIVKVWLYSPKKNSKPDAVSNADVSDAISEEDDIVNSPLD